VEIVLLLGQARGLEVKDNRRRA